VSLKGLLYPSNANIDGKLLTKHRLEIRNSDERITYIRITTYQVNLDIIMT